MSAQEAVVQMARGNISLETCRQRLIAAGIPQQDAARLIAAARQNLTGIK